MIERSTLKLLALRKRPPLCAIAGNDDKSSTSVKTSRQQCTHLDYGLHQKSVDVEATIPTMVVVQMLPLNQLHQRINKQCYLNWHELGVYL
jgi:hypothetical protein